MLNLFSGLVLPVPGIKMHLLHYRKSFSHWLTNILGSVVKTVQPKIMIKSLNLIQCPLPLYYYPTSQPRLKWEGKGWRKQKNILTWYSPKLAPDFLCLVDTCSIFILSRCFYGFFGDSYTFLWPSLGQCILFLPTVAPPLFPVSGGSLYIQISQELKWHQTGSIHICSESFAGPALGSQANLSAAVSLFS